MTFKQKIYNGLAVAAIVGGLASIGGYIYSEGQSKRPLCLREIERLESKLNGGCFGCDEDRIPATIEKLVSAKKEALEQYEKLVSDSECLTAIKKYNAERDESEAYKMLLFLGGLALCMAGGFRGVYVKTMGVLTEKVYQ